MTIDWCWVDKRVYMDANDLLAWIAVTGSEDGVTDRLQRLIEDAEATGERR